MRSNQRFFGLKAHIVRDTEGGLVHTVTTTLPGEADFELVADLLHSKEQLVWADSDYRGAATRGIREDL